MSLDRDRTRTALSRDGRTNHAATAASTGGSNSGLNAVPSPILTFQKSLFADIRYLLRYWEMRIEFEIENENDYSILVCRLNIFA